MLSSSLNRWLQNVIAAGIVVAVALTSGLASAATETWQGPGTDLGTAANWNGGSPNVNGDTALWNGTVSGPLALTYTGGLSGSPGNLGIGISLNGSQTGSLTITAANSGPSMRISGITISSGAGAFTLGGGANPITMTMGGAAGTQTLQNDSSNTATVNSNVTFNNGGGGAHIYTFAGAGNWSVNNNIANGGSGSIAIAKTGAGTLTLSGANTYSAGTTIGASAGAAVVRAAATQALGTGTITFDSTGNGSTARLELTGNISLNNNVAFPARNNTSVGVENISGNNTMSGLFTLGSGGSSYTVQSDADLLTLSGGTAVTVGSGNRVLTLQGNGNGQVSGVLQNGSGTLGITKSGTGTWTLAGNSTYTGVTTVNGGVLSVTGTVNTSASTNTTLVGNVAGNAVVKVSGLLKQNNLYIGNVSGAVGALYQTGGTVANTATSGDTTLSVGRITGGYGYYNLSNGLLSTNELQIASWGTTNWNGSSGLLDMSGGSITTGWLPMTRAQIALAQTGVLNMSGGQITYNGGGLAANWGTTQTAIINVSGGTLATNVSGNQPINLNWSGDSSNVGILNLNGGVVRPSQIIGNYGTVNFNGGTLQANSTQSNFISVGNAYINSGGATIDTNNQSVTISQALSAPTGSGVSTIAFSNSGSGYVAAPIVTITGGAGAGATAVANMVDDGTGNGTYKIASITVTNPGVYTDLSAATVTLTGGGAATAASGFTINSSANTGGGLTKVGSGTLTLAGNNTYIGNTSVNAGALVINGNPSGGGNFNVLGGATLGGSGTVTGGTVTFNSGATLAPHAGAPAGSLLTLTLPAVTLSNGATASFNLSGTNTYAGSGYNDLVNVSNNLSLAGTTSVYVNVVDNGGAFQTSGTSSYELFSYGALSGFNTGSFTLSDTGILTSRQRAQFVNNTGSNQIDLDIIGVAGNLTWVGSNGASWDNSGGTTNWFNSNNNALDKFVKGDNVTFAAAASANPPVPAIAGSGTVTINAAVAPASVTVSGGSYTFSGAGKITGITGLTVYNGAALTIANTNDYSGGTQLQGLIALATNNALPVVNTGLSISGGTLDLAGYNQQIDSFASYSYGLITASSGNSTLTYANSALSSQFSGTIADTAPSGGTLGLRVSSGTLDVTSATTTYTGATTVNIGVLLANSIPNSTGYSVGPSGSLSINTANAAYGTSYSNSGSASFGNSSGTITMTGPTGGGITSTAGAVLNVPYGSQGFGGAAALYKSGTGTLVLTGNSTYTGGTTFDQGTIQAGPGSAQPNGPGVGDFVFDNAAHSAVLDLNGQNISIGAISQPNASTTNVITNSASGTTATLTVGSNGDTTTFAGVLQNGAGTLALATGGAGTFTLTNTNTYTGGTTIGGGGVLIAANSYSLPYGPLGFNTAGGTLVAPAALTAPSINFSTSGTLYGAISAPSLTVTGSVFQLGGGTPSSSETLDLTAVSTFVYSNSTGAFHVGGSVNVSANNTPGSTGTLIMAQTNTITAASFGVADNTGYNGPNNNIGNVYLGQTNAINASAISVDGASKGLGLMQFQSTLAANPTLVLRDSTGSGRAALLVGYNTSNYYSSGGTIDLVTGVNGSSVLDALISGGTIGEATGASSTGGASTGVVNMGGGTLNAQSLSLAVATGLCNTTGILNVNGGSVIVGTLTMGKQSSTGVPTSVFTLDGGGRLSATLVPAGTGTQTFNWNDGTIANYNTSGSTTGLTVSIPTITLANTGTHTLWIDAGQTGTINSSLAGGGGAVDFIKDGPGTAILTGNNSYTGTTFVDNGTLKLTGTAGFSSGGINIGGGSFINDSSVPASQVTGVALTSGTLGGTGTFSNATVVVSPSLSNTIVGGDSGSGTLTVNTLTFNGAGRIEVSFGTTQVVATTLNANGAAGSVVIQNGGGYPTAAGEYPLVQYSGSIGGTGSAAFALGTLPPRTNAHLDFSNPGVIDYDLTSIDYPVWTGSASSTWSTAAIASPKNWKLAITGSATDFLTGDNVVFNDTAHTGNVQISAANVQPASVTFSNTALPYTITGPYGIADYSSSQSTAVTLSGSGLVVFATSNSYTGGTNINGGTLQLGNGAADGSIAGNVNDNSVLAFNPATTATLAGVISGSGAVEMGGSGRMILTGANLYSGGTTINGGTLQLGNGVTSGSISGSVTNNGVLAFNQPAASQFDGVINGTGALAQNGTNVLTLTASNGYTGTTYVNAGALSIGSGGTGQSLASAAIVNNSGLVFNHTDTMTYAGNISGSGTLGKVAAGTTVLTGSNNYTGLTTLAGGMLELGSPNALAGSGNITFTGGALEYSPSNTADVSNQIVNSTSAISVLTNGATVQWNSSLSSSNTGGLTIVGPGMLVLANSNNYSGTTQIGVLQGQGQIYAVVRATASQALGTGTISFDWGGNATQGRLELANNITLNNPITMYGRISGTPAIENISDSNTLSGGITLQIGGTYYIQSDAGLLTVSGGTSITSAAGGARDVKLQGNGNGLISGAVVNGAATSGLSLTKLGSGTWTISSANNTYTGGSNVNAGVLQFAKVLAMPPSGTVTVAGNAVLAVNAGGDGEFTNATSGNGSIGGLLAGVGGQGGPVSWSSGAFLGIDASNAAGGLTYSGSIADTTGGSLGLVELGSGTLTLSGTNTYTGGTEVLGGTLVLSSPSAIEDGTSLTVGDPGAFAAAAPIVPLSPATAAAAVAPVPEPGTLVLLAAGAAATFVALRRRKRSGLLPNK